MIHIDALATDHTPAAELSSLRIRADLADLPKLPKLVHLTAAGRGYIGFRANGTNGGVNETGIKRIKALLRAADKHGIGVTFEQPAFVKDELNIKLWEFGMRHLTRAELEALLG